MLNALLLTALLATPEPGSVEWTLDMHERFAYSAMMRTAFIHDQVDRASRHAQQLEESLREHADEGTARVRDAAHRAASAETIVEQGAAIAQTAEACGACHEASQVQPMFGGRRGAPGGDSLAARMGRHIWAADRMWEALIAHSEPNWSRGARALSSQPFFFEGDEIGDRIDAVRDIAVDAVNADDWAQRAEVYGRFLAACAGCHEDYSR